MNLNFNFARRAIFNLVATAGLFFFAQASHANLIINGGFEDGLTGWTCALGTDGYCSTGAQGTPQEGDAHFWGWDNSTGGSVSQSFSTVVGATYSLSFYYGSYAPTPPNYLSVMVGDFAQDFTFTVGGDASWGYLTTTFTALADLTSLGFFFDTDPGTGQLWLDGVAVEAAAVPESMSLILLAFGLLGLGLSRQKKIA